MLEYKFKEGDRVRVVADTYLSMLGASGTFHHYDKTHAWIDIDDQWVVKDTPRVCIEEERLKLIKTAEEIAPILWQSYCNVLNEEALAALRQVIEDVENHEKMGFTDSDDIIYAFTWCSTMQGEIFWDEVDDGKYNKTSVTTTQELQDKSEEDTGSAATSKHYNAQAIQPIELMQMSFSPEEFKGFLKGNILKYSMRAGSKSGESVFKDTVKAKQYKMWLDLVEDGIKIDPRVHVVIKENE